MLLLKLMAAVGHRQQDGDIVGFSEKPVHNISQGNHLIGTKGMFSENWPFINKNEGGSSLCEYVLAGTSVSTSRFM